MKFRIKNGVKIRKDVFGGICYVPHRDDFFALDKSVFALVNEQNYTWKSIEPEWAATYSALAKVGICETKDPVVNEESYSGPAFLGNFVEIPTVSEPLVVNCFCTAFCPLQCIYCHADDLMKDFRDKETDIDLDNVAAMASILPAMVLVITGGDPLSRPDRAKYLIERLSKQKSLVLDTSGVDDIEVLMPTLIEHNVHVRVSLDTLTPDNTKLRRGNAKLGYAPDASIKGAMLTIEKCLKQNIPLTVQTVISSKNDRLESLKDFRDWLVKRGVRNWVLHVVVEAGAARKLKEASRKHKRERSIFPQSDIYKTLWSLVEDTIKNNKPIDIRCTDTDNTPNSVLLISSKGDLYTEGYAHRGKVLLYDINQSRPDLVQALWPHLDRFGHARRYLNWHRDFFYRESLENICYKIPFPNNNIAKSQPNPVETEAKYHVPNPNELKKILKKLGYKSKKMVVQRDEYFHTDEMLSLRLDYVVRLRNENGSMKIALKSPRIWSGKEYSRIELEIPAGGYTQVCDALRKHGFEISWFLEKRRTEFLSPERSLIVALDEIPEIGFFAEIEGNLDDVRRATTELSNALGVQESSNYKELFMSYKLNQGYLEAEIKGAGFN